MAMPKFRWPLRRKIQLNRRDIDDTITWNEIKELTNCIKVSSQIDPLTLIVLGDFLITLYWGAFLAPFFFSKTTRDIRIRLTPIVL